ncbi:MAG: zinc-dependent metalloprotease [Bowdeniella nasicola]|nr:zinc-dependent metalloprotease [Bowdeniella nasicola]
MTARSRTTDPTRRQARILARLTPPGPAGTRAELRAIVEILHRSAAEAPEEVGRITGLNRAAKAAARVPVYVVDRPRFQAANRELLTQIAGPVLPGRDLETLPTDAALSFLSTKVLGQYDPLARRLLLVAPNVVKIENELDLDGMDFRRWVCLHEATHAVQFAAAPWLSEFMVTKVREILRAGEQGSDLTAFAAWLSAVIRGRGQDVADAIVPPEAASLMAEVSALMALLEGHADVVMDSISPARMPSVRRIRAAFDERRNRPNRVTARLNAAIGMDVKLAQYRDGAAFVRAVVNDGGHARLNAVFADPRHLPSPDEIREPHAWLARVTA